MAVELTPLGRAVFGTLKWVGAPLLAAYIGYAFLGPRVGGSVVKRLKRLPGVSTNVENETPETQPRTSDKAKKFQEIRGIGN